MPPPGVLVARVKANLAQYRRLSGTKKAPSEITLGGVRVNTGTHRVFVDDREIELKNKEYELLLFLMLNVDMVFDRETLYEKVWDWRLWAIMQQSLCTSTAFGKKSRKILPNHAILKRSGVPGIGSGGEYYVNCVFLPCIP